VARKFRRASGVQCREWLVEHRQPRPLSSVSAPAPPWALWPPDSCAHAAGRAECAQLLQPVSAPSAGVPPPPPPPSWVQVSPRSGCGPRCELAVAADLLGRDPIPARNAVSVPRRTAQTRSRAASRPCRARRGPQASCVFLPVLPHHAQPSPRSRSPSTRQRADRAGSAWNAPVSRFRFTCDLLRFRESRSPPPAA